MDRPFPSEISVLAALDAYLAENGFTVDEYDLAAVKVTLWGVTFTLPNPVARRVAVRFHDLHHIVTGYGTDPVGEAEISAWELRRGLGVFGLYVKAIIFMATMLGFVHSPRLTWRAWCAARSDTPLQPATLSRYDQLLGVTVGELRALYDVPAEGLTGRRALNENAPARPQLR